MRGDAVYKLYGWLLGCFVMLIRVFYVRALGYVYTLQLHLQLYLLFTVVFSYHKKL